MTKTEALKVLERHQEWRKGRPTTATDPFELTRALEVAIGLLKQDLSYCQCKRPLPNQKGPVFECMNCDKEMR